MILNSVALMGRHGGFLQGLYMVVALKLLAITIAINFTTADDSRAA
jgi:hypothetical protein